METIHDEVEEWVQDPGTTAGRIAAYDRIVSTYWVTKGLFSHVLMEHENKAMGDTELACALRDHNNDCRLMYKKVDLITMEMGITLYPLNPQPSVGICSGSGGSARCDDGFKRSGGAATPPGSWASMSRTLKLVAAVCKLLCMGPFHFLCFVYGNFLMWMAT